MNQRKKFRELSFLQLFSIIIAASCVPLIVTGQIVIATLAIIALGLTIYAITKKMTVSSKREGWLPLRYLIYKEIIIIAGIIIMYIQNSVGAGLTYIPIMVLVGSVFNIIAFIKSAKRLWQVEFIYLTMLLNLYLALLPTFFH